MFRPPVGSGRGDEDESGRRRHSSRVKFLPLAWAGMPKTSFRKNSDSPLPGHADLLRNFLAEVWHTSAELRKLPDQAGAAFVVSHALSNRRIIKHHKSTLQDVFDAFAENPGNGALAK